jgi:hypothetical protein
VDQGCALTIVGSQNLRSPRTTVTTIVVFLH